MDEELDRIVSSTQEHDMLDHPDEQYFRRCYLYWIFKALDETLKTNEENRQTLIDIGCGQGRLTVPTVARYENITSVGVDLSDDAISRARSYAKTEGVGKRCMFECREALEKIGEIGSETQDLIFLNEVIFYAKNYLRILEESFRILKKGGIAFLSFRSRYFNLAYIVSNGLFDKINSVVNSNQGKIFGEDLTFSWHDYSEAAQILNDIGFEIIDSTGIGIFSGLPGDPMGSWCLPSELTEKELEKLFDLEIRVAKQFRNNARYILFRGTKS
jgi:ubiquinone/menaquinone biosynthesis C-methylase UbiE